MTYVWSYTSIVSLEKCPQEFYRRYILKEKSTSPALEHGNAVHKAIEEYLKNKTSPLAKIGGPAASLVESIKYKAKGKILCVEQKMGLNGIIEPVGFFDDNVWGRGAADVIIIDYPNAVLADWKTGKVREKVAQLAVLALFVFKHYPRVEKITAFNVWLDHGKIGQIYTFTRDMESTLWATMMPKIEAAETFAKNPPDRMPACQCGWCNKR